MDKIFLSNTELPNLISYQTTSKNGESDLYLLDKYLVKIYRNIEQASLSSNRRSYSTTVRLKALLEAGNILSTKTDLYKITVVPKYEIWNLENEEFLGFLLPFIDMPTIEETLESKSMEYCLEILKQASINLMLHHNNGVILSDIHSHNILTDGKDIVYCDNIGGKIDGKCIPQTIVFPKKKSIKTLIPLDFRITKNRDIALFTRMAAKLLCEISISSDYHNKITSLSLDKEIEKILLMVASPLSYYINLPYFHEYADLLPHDRIRTK